jgi:solute carrier family 25 (mitochondrial carnitine/acylcarnitine transporter), member 20/29
VSGAAKLVVGHPFDLVKIRLQVSGKDQFTGPIDCLIKTVRREGPHALYKGVTPPMLGWMISDSVMLGSLTFYRKALLEYGYKQTTWAGKLSSTQISERLPTLGHAMAGMLAGWTVSVVACPIEQVKSRLQVQYAVTKSQRFYSGPIDCANRIVRSHGIGGLYSGFTSSLAFRSFFFFWWGSYDIFSKAFKRTSVSEPIGDFLAGGLSAQVFWLGAFPLDAIKARIMTDSMGGRLGDGVPKYDSMRSAARSIYQQGGLKGFYRGFVPCFLRAFPANGTALLAFEATMRWMDGAQTSRSMSSM